MHSTFGLYLWGLPIGLCSLGSTYSSACFIRSGVMFLINEVRVLGKFCSGSRGDTIVVTFVDAEAPKVDAEKVKEEWRLLWRGRIDDKVRAEGVADRSFSLLAVERGTVIVATRDFKALNLKEILRSCNVQNVDRVAGPYPSEGGWAKFAKTVLNKQTRAQKSRAEALPERRGKSTQLKKGGRGWLHK